MPADLPLGLAEQLGQLLLIRLQGFRLEHRVDMGGPVFALVDHELLRFGHHATLLTMQNSCGTHNSLCA